MNKAFIGVLVAIFLAFGGLVIWNITSRPAEIDWSEFDETRYIGPNEHNGFIGDHVRGNPDSEIIIIEFGDFQCSGCAQSQARMEKLSEEYGDKIGIIFRNYPLSGYANSLAAASAAEAAGLLDGLYWEMADYLYVNQATWGYTQGQARNNAFISLFEMAGGTDNDAFIEKMSGSDVKKKIEFDQALGRRANLTATPAFYVDGKAIDTSGAANEEEFMDVFRKIINEKLAAE